MRALLDRKRNVMRNSLKVLLAVLLLLVSGGAFAGLLFAPTGSAPASCNAIAALGDVSGAIAFTSAGVIKLTCP